MPVSLPETIARHAREQGSAIALSDNHGQLSYADLAAAMDAWSDNLTGDVLGIMLDNGPAWVVVDLAARQRGVTCVPLPVFFSDEQLRHIIKTAGIDCIVTDQPARIERCLPVEASHALSHLGDDVHVYRLHGMALAGRHAGITKITFTSGTTGAPKGVCLGAEILDQVAHAMHTVSGACRDDCMLSLLPLSTLLENIAVHAGLMAGGQVHLPSLNDTGVSMTGVDSEKLCRLISTVRPGYIVIVPEILRVLIGAVDAGWQPPTSLRFIAVGGAKVSPALLEKAQQQGLPVFQGYGLSEAASVVCLNHPGANRPGSVGRPLPHVQVTVGEDGEVFINGGLFSGYLNEPGCIDDVWPTGDLGRLDDDGYLYIEGRRKNVFITSYGRNISPEWIESELTAEPAIASTIVFGDSRPWNIALIVPTAAAGADAVAAAVERANRRLPDYAGIRRFHICSQPFSLMTGEMTTNGRLRRDVIEQNHRDLIEQLYLEKDYAVL